MCPSHKHSDKLISVLMTTKSSSSEFLNNNTPIKNPSSISSNYLQTVSLEDWWLVKSDDGKRLCIGGLDIRENRAKRVFSSAPIAVRYDLVTLKSADGINILIKGIINNSRTQENGFSSEVCSRFLLGFPYDWKGVVDPCLGQESAGNGAPTIESSYDESKDGLSSLPNCLRGKENIGTVDHLFPVPGVPVNSVIRKDIHIDVLGNRRGNDVENSDMLISADLISSNPVLGDSLPVEVPCHKQRFKNEINHERKQGLLHALDGETVANEDELLSNDEEKLKGDGCNELEEYIESAGDDLCVLNAKAVESADLDLLATEGTFIVEVDSGVIEGTVETEDNYLPNKQDNLNDYANPSVVNMVPPINLKSLSDKFESAKSTSKGDKKTFTNMKSEEPENPSCSYAGMDELVKGVPASISSDVKIADPYEASVAVPVDMLSTKLAEAKGVVTKGKVCCKKKKGTNSRSISGSPGSVSNPSSCDVDSVKEIRSSSNGRRASSRIKILANNLKDDQPTNSKTQREKEKFNSVFVGSDSVNSKVANTDGELGGTSTPDPPIVQLHGNIPDKRQLHDLYSKDGCRADFMQSSVSTGAVKKNYGSGIDGTESGELRKSCGSLNKVGDVKDASDLMSQKREESKHNQPGTSGSKTTKKEVPLLPSSNCKKKKRCSGAGKRPNINHKRLRSGSKPEPLKAKRKLI